MRVPCVLNGYANNNVHLVERLGAVLQVGLAIAADLETLRVLHHLHT